MDHTELLVVKRYQREFKELFNKTLEIDWNAMNGTDDTRRPFLKNSEIEIAVDTKVFEGGKELTLEDVLEICVNRYGADIEKIRDRKSRLHRGGFSRERNAMIDYANIIFKNRINTIEAARLVNRDRSVLYHYYKLHKYKIVL